MDSSREDEETTAVGAHGLGVNETEAVRAGWQTVQTGDKSVDKHSSDLG